MANAIKRCTSLTPVTFVDVYDEDSLDAITTNYWNSSWGVVALFPRLVPLTVTINARAAICGNLNYTFQNGRRYRIVCQLRALTVVTAISGTTVNLYDGAAVVAGSGNQHTNVALTTYGHIHAEFFIDGVGQTHTALHFEAIGPNQTAHIDPPSQFYVEDIGPVTRGSTGVSGPDWSGADARYINVTGDTMTADLLVPDEIYGTGWNGSLEVPTKNAVYDKIESIVSGTITAASTTYAGSTNLVATNVEAALDELDAEKQPLDTDLTTIAALAPANDTVIQRKGGLWVASTPATVKTDLALTKTDVGLANVDNTTDLLKPVSTATQTALNLKANSAITVTGTGSLTGGGDLTTNRTLDVAAAGITLAKMANLNQDQVIGRITASAGVPETFTITAAARTVLDDTTTAAMITTLGAQPLDTDLTTIAALIQANGSVIQSNGTAWTAVTPATLKTSLALTKTDVGLTNVDNTTDLTKPISTATQTALNAKQDLDADLTAIAGQTATTNNILQSVASAWASRTPTQVTATLDLFATTATTKGLVPGSNNATTLFLRGDGVWAVPTGMAAASETVSGIVELATTVEATALVDTTRAITAAGLGAALTAQSFISSSSANTLFLNAAGDSMTGPLNLDNMGAALVFRRSDLVTLTTMTSSNSWFDINGAGSIGTRLQSGGATRFQVDGSGAVATGTSLMVWNTTPTMSLKDITGATTYASLLATSALGAINVPLTSQQVQLQVAGAAKLTASNTVITAAVDLIVPEEAYGASWNGSLAVPTKNALYDMIETIAGAAASDEVFVGTSDPGTGYNLWYDTDEDAGSVMTQADADARYALGTIAYAQAAANQGSITTVIDITGLTVTFTAVLGRSYKITGSALYYSTVANDIARTDITNSANTVFQTFNVTCTSTTIGIATQRSIILSNLSGSVTFKMRAQRAAGTGTLTMNAAGTAPAFLLVEDIGIL